MTIQDSLSGGDVFSIASDALGGIIGGNEASNAINDALRQALNLVRDSQNTTRSDVAPQLGLGQNSANELNALFFGTQADYGYGPGVEPPADLNALQAAVAGVDTNRTGAQNAANRRIGRLDDLLSVDTSGFTSRQSNQHNRRIDNVLSNLNINLDRLGLDIGDFGATATTPAAGPSLDPFLNSPQYALAVDDEGIVAQNVLKQLSASGLADSGIGRQAVTDALSRNATSAFNSYINTLTGQSNIGLGAANTAAGVGANAAAAGGNILAQMGTIDAGQALNVAGTLSDIYPSIQGLARQAPIPGQFA